MKNRRKIKRLSLERWMTKPEHYPYDLKEIDAIIGKDGWYLSDRIFIGEDGNYHISPNYSWFEFNGKAWTGCDLSSQFKYEFREYNRPKLSTEQREAIKILYEHPELRIYLKELNMYRFLENAFRAAAVCGFKLKKDRIRRIGK